MNYISAFDHWQEINRVRKFFYFRYCENPTERNLDTFLKWRDKADKAHNIMLRHLWS